MILLPTSLAVRPHLLVKALFFGARGDSCSCDPCDCNPCSCGSSLTQNLPFWRVSGYFIEEGSSESVDLSQLILLSLAQPDREGIWRETLVVSQEATPEQAETLLTLFEEDIESFPAELGPQPRSLRAVYRASLTYLPDVRRPLLRATLTQDRMTQIRGSEDHGPSGFGEWTYDGPVALREAVERRF